VQCGGSTRISNLLHAAFLLVFLTLGMRFIAQIPMAALAGVTAWMGARLLDWSTWRRLRKIAARGCHGIRHHRCSGVGGERRCGGRHRLFVLCGAESLVALVHSPLRLGRQAVGDMNGAAQVKKVYGKAGFCVVPEIDRPPKTIIDQLAEFPVSIIGDGMGRRGIMDPGLKALNRDVKMCGPAVTVETRAADNLMVHAALKWPSQATCRCEHPWNLSAGIWGEITTRMAIRKGWRSGDGWIGSRQP